MGKAPPLNKKPARKQKDLNNVKNGFIDKKKLPKYKNTPSGKVTLLNDSKPKNDKNVQGKKNQKNNYQISPKGKKISEISVKTKGVDNTNTEQKKKQMSKQNKSINAKKQGKEINAWLSNAKEDESDSNVSDNLDNSLMENSDEDNSDFGKKENTEGAGKKNKGVKMFAGINSSKKGANDKNDEDDEESDEEAEKYMSLNTSSSTSNSMDNEDQTDEEEDSDDEDSTAEPGLKALLGDTIQDDDNDEDFNTDDTDDDDDDDEDEDEDDVEDEDGTLQNLSMESTEENESDEYEDDESDQEEDTDDDEESKLQPGLKDLLGNTLQDDDSDEDFDGTEEDDEDDDISDEDEDENDINEAEEETEKLDKKRKDNKNQNNIKKEPKQTPEELLEKDKRTIFVGNIPKATTKAQLRKFFSQCGNIDNIRIRGIVPDNEKTPLKVAAIKKQLHPKLNVICAFIIFKSQDSVKKALAHNGKIFEGNYLRVDTIIKEEKNKVAQKKAIFLGNLPFKIEENIIWKVFNKCGDIESVRVIRDRKSGAGIGIGYVNFKTETAAQLALELNGTKVDNREIRVKPYADTQGTKKQKGNKRPHPKQTKNPGTNKKHKTESENVEQATHNSINAERRKDSKTKKSQGERTRGKSNTSSSSDKSPMPFQGQKGDTKKKNKGHKLDKKKKILAAKLVAKSKKPKNN